METQKQEKKNRFGPLAAAAYFAFAGVGGLLSGFTHLSKLSSDFSGIVLSDTLFNSLIGILNLVSAYLLWKEEKSCYLGLRRIIHNSPDICSYNGQGNKYCNVSF